jgi:RecA-family ATPase
MFDPDVRGDFSDGEAIHQQHREQEMQRLRETLASMPETPIDLGPEAPPLRDGSKPSDVVIAKEGTVLEMMQRYGAPKENTAWGCYNVWKPGALTLVVGTQQSFKSWAMFDLMLHAAQGKDWLGHALDDFGAVVYVSNEKSQQAVYERLYKVFSEDKRAANKVYIYHRGDRIHFGNENWKRMVQFIKDDLPSQRVLLILDTLTSLAPPGYDENSLTHVSVVLEAIRDVQDEARVDVMLLHHLNAAGERPRGHTSLDGEADGFVRMNRKGRDMDEVFVTFEPKDGLPSTGAFRFNPDTGTFKRSASRALHISNLREIVRWWEERNNGEGITIKEMRERFYTAHRYDAVEKVVDEAIRQLVLKREVRRSMLTNREANLINTLSEEEREIILERRRRDYDIERDVEVKANAEMEARQVMEGKARRASQFLPADDDDGLGSLL